MVCDLTEIALVRHGAHALTVPALTPIELGDQHQQTVGSGVDVCGELCDVGFELIAGELLMGRTTRGGFNGKYVHGLHT
jgi:hypothetical protein